MCWRLNALYNSVLKVEALRGDWACSLCPPEWFNAAFVEAGHLLQDEVPSERVNLSVCYDATKHTSWPLELQTEIPALLVCLYNLPSVKYSVTIAAPNGLRQPLACWPCFLSCLFHATIAVTSTR